MCVRSSVSGSGLVGHELRIDEAVIKKVSEFCYLGSIIANDSDLGQTKDVLRLQNF